MFKKHNGEHTRLIKPLFSFLLLAVISFAPLQGLAQQEQTPPDLLQMDLEDLMKIKVQPVYGASKHLQKVTQAAASVTIITAEEIQSFGYRTLADTLRSVPGFY